MDFIFIRNIFFPLQNHLTPCLDHEINKNTQIKDVIGINTSKQNASLSV